MHHERLAMVSPAPGNHQAKVRKSVCYEKPYTNQDMSWIAQAEKETPARMILAGVSVAGWSGLRS